MSAMPGGPQPAQIPLSREIEALQVAEIYRNLGVSAGAAFFGTMLCVTVFYEDGLRARHILWLAYGTFVAALRLGICWLHRNAPSTTGLQPVHWARLAVLGSFLAGIQWGLLGTWLYPDDPGYRQAFTMMVITCFVGGSVTAYAPVRWAHTALALPATLPPTVYIFFIHSGVHPMAGFTALFFVAMIVYYAFRENDLVVQRLRAEAFRRRELQAMQDLAASARELPPLDTSLARPYR